MKKSCVIGWPINHSRSPLIHNYWLRMHGIEATYERLPIEPSRLREFIGSLASSDYLGCNVTLPHKEAVYSLVNVEDPVTLRLGVVNTVFMKNGIAHGTSTDGEGFLASVKARTPTFSLRDRRVVMLGAGGASLAIAGAVLDAGASELAVANRNAERVAALGKRFGKRVKPVEWENRAGTLPECGLLVNATPLGMTGQPPLSIDLSLLPRDAVVIDIVYTPLRTALLEDAQRRGNVVVEGLGMLLHQAVRGFQLWFGVRPTVTPELYDLVARDIDPQYAQ